MTRAIYRYLARKLDAAAKWCRAREQAKVKRRGPRKAKGVVS